MKRVCLPSEGAEVATPAPTRKKNIIRTALLSVFSMLVLLGVAPAAGASTVGYAWWTGTVYYVASAGEANNLTVLETPGYYVFSDPNATITAQYGCTATDAHNATCASKYIKSLYLKTSDGDDTVSILPPLIATYLDCGTGTDSLNTSNPNTKPVNCEYINAPSAGPVNPPTVTRTPSPLAIVQHSSTMTKKGSVPLTLSCSAAAASSCTGTITFELPATSAKGRVMTSRRGAPNILGRERLTVDKGKKRKVKISMTGKGRSMVKRAKKLKVTAKLKIRQGGKTTTSRQSLTINAPSRR